MDLKPWLWYVINGVIAGAVVIALMAKATSNPQRVPGRFQNFFELIFSGMKDLFLGALGDNGERHLPLVFTLFFYILIGNLIGFVPGLTSPTAATSTTMALGLAVFFYVQYWGIRTNGLLGYLKHFLGPVLFLAPLFIFIEIIGEIAKPISLGMRLFGNIFGEDQIVDVIMKAEGHNVILHIIPLQIFINLLQVFTDLIQAFIFALLTCAYIAIMTTTHHDEGDQHDSHPHEKANDEKMKEQMAGLGGNL